MSSLNKAQLIGRLGKDPEIRHTQDGKPIATFTLATSEQWKSKSGEKQERTEWHTIVIFSEGLAKLAEEYLEKGSQVYIEGQIRTRKWQDKEGNDRYSTEIVLDSFNGTMKFLARANGGGQREGAEAKPKAEAKSKPKPKAEAPAEEPLDDEIPF